MNMTKHAKKRMQQRGIHDNDLDLIIRFGQWVKGGVFFGRKSGREAKDTTLKMGISLSKKKQVIQRLDKLVGKFVVIDFGSDTVLTVYPVTQKYKKRQLVSA